MVRWGRTIIFYWHLRVCDRTCKQCQCMKCQISYAISLIILQSLFYYLNAERTNKNILSFVKTSMRSVLQNTIFFSHTNLLPYPGRSSINFYHTPGRGGQTEVTPDQTSFERTHIPSALELHGLEKASSALLSGQWSGTCLIRGHFGLIRGHFGLGRSDQRQFQAHTSLIRGRFERTFFKFFC